MICLTFDIEEFDRVPVRYNVPLPLTKQMAIAAEGTQSIINLMAGMGVKATFFVTDVFAQARPDLVRRMVIDGHEVASFGLGHSASELQDNQASRTRLEQISDSRVVGYRSRGMICGSSEALNLAGYRYDSSLNPCWLPGCHNNPKTPSTIHNIGNSIIEVPLSVCTPLAIPLFWLSLHLMPLNIYQWLSKQAIKENGYLNINLHSWEFSEDLHNKELKIPFYIQYNSGEKLINRLACFIESFKQSGATFGTINELTRTKQLK